MGLLDRGQAMVNRSHKTGGGGSAVSVTYSRKVGAATQTVTLTARHGRFIAGSRQEEAGTAVVFSERVYLVEVADLILGGQATTPDLGDRITEGSQVWELSRPDTGEPGWRYSDQTRTLYRCFMKRAS